MNRPTRDTVAGRAYLDLQNLARKQARPNAELQQLYVLEGFLARLAAHPEPTHLVLKGGALLAAFGDRRPTRDLDFQASHQSNDTAEVLEVVRAVASTPLPDGLEFDIDTGRAATIREGEDYSGVRVSMQASLAGARLTFHVDVNFGDPLWPGPEPVAVPRILGGPPILVMGYPLHMVLAEKLVTAIDLGTVNTRWRDFGDLWTLTRTHPIAGSDLTVAVEEVARYRRVTILPLAEALTGFGSHGQARWAAWRTRQRLEALPPNFSTVVGALIDFADPVLAGQAANSDWDPQATTWRPLTHD